MIRQSVQDRTFSLYETIGEILERFYLLRMTPVRGSDVSHLATRLTKLYGSVVMVYASVREVCN